MVYGNNGPRGTVAWRVGMAAQPVAWFMRQKRSSWVTFKRSGYSIWQLSVLALCKVLQIKRLQSGHF
jgi:hypothetical protein